MHWQPEMAQAVAHGVRTQTSKVLYRHAAAMFSGVKPVALNVVTQKTWHDRHVWRCVAVTKARDERRGGEVTLLALPMIT